MKSVLFNAKWAAYGPKPLVVRMKVILFSGSLGAEANHPGAPERLASGGFQNPTEASRPGAPERLASVGFTFGTS